MTHPNKRRGNDLERELVRQALAAGIPAVRAWGSDGRSLGLESDVDMVLGRGHCQNLVQVKRTKTIASKYQLPDSCDAVVFRCDRGESTAMITYERFLELLQYEQAATSTELRQ